MSAAGPTTGPWREIVDAAGRPRPAGPAAELSCVDGVPRLGWVRPPPWPAVVRALAPVADLLRAPRLLVLGTGGWAFGARALAGAAPAGDRLRVCDLLDPAPLAAAAGGLPRPAVLAVSESGRTSETVALAAAVRGLPVRWLTGDAVSLAPVTPTTALLGAPLSVPFLLAAAVAAGDGTGADGGPTPGLAPAYRGFARDAAAIGEWAAAAAGRVPAGRSRIRVELPRGSGPGLTLFATQALRQGLGGKEGTARPWLEVAVTGTARAGPTPAGPTDVLLTVPARAGGRHRLGRLMARCYAICALVACAGVRHGIAYAAHPGVDRYKRLLAGPGAAPGPVPEPVPPAEIVRVSAGWLRTRGFAAGHLVCYEPRLVPRLVRARARLAAGSGRPWEVHAGSAWNHHSYQAVQAEADIGVVAVAPAGRHPLSRRQAEIAAATCASLGERALLLRPAGPGAAGRAP